MCPCCYFYFRGLKAGARFVDRNDIGALIGAACVPVATLSVPEEIRGLWDALV